MAEKPKMGGGMDMGKAIENFLRMVAPDSMVEKMDATKKKICEQEGGEWDRTGGRCVYPDRK